MATKSLKIYKNKTLIRPSEKNKTPDYSAIVIYDWLVAEFEASWQHRPIYSVFKEISRKRVLLFTKLTRPTGGKHTVTS
jgi:hypothetical protein